jgi:hypothetical protein
MPKIKKSTRARLSSLRGTKKSLQFLLTAVPKSKPLFKVEQNQTCSFLFDQFLNRILTPAAEYFLEIIKVHQFQGLARAHLQTNGVFHVDTTVAFQGDFSLRPGEDDPIRAEHRAGPAGDAPVFLDNHQIGFGLPDQRSGQAGIQAGRFEAMPALQGYRGERPSFNTQPSLGQGCLLDGFE